MYSFAIHKAAMADIDNVEAFTRTTRFSETGPNGWQHSFEYEYRDGRKVTLEGTFYDAVVFPASAGVQLLYFVRPAEGDPETFDIEAAINRETVIGWEIHSDEGYVSVERITERGYEDCNYINPSRGFSAIQFPDGTVEWSAGNSSWVGNVTAWVSKIRELWAAQIADERTDAKEKDVLSAIKAVQLKAELELRRAVDGVKKDICHCLEENKIEDGGAHDLFQTLEDSCAAGSRKIITDLKHRALKRMREVGTRG